jgi:hypothetical protein
MGLWYSCLPGPLLGRLLAAALAAEAVRGGKMIPPRSDLYEFIMAMKAVYARHTCPTYSYWYDLKTDLRRPRSWLDLVNMILRRFRLILVKTMDGKTTTWRLRGWLGLLDEIHEQRRCEVCRKL